MKTTICSIGECMIEMTNLEKELYNYSVAGDTLNFNFNTGKSEFPLGVSWNTDFVKIEQIKYSFIGAVSMGVKKTFSVLFDDPCLQFPSMSNSSFSYDILKPHLCKHFFSKARYSFSLRE